MTLSREEAIARILAEGEPRRMRRVVRGLDMTRFRNGQSATLRTKTEETPDRRLAKIAAVVAELRESWAPYREMVYHYRFEQHPPRSQGFVASGLHISQSTVSRVEKELIREIRAAVHTACPRVRRGVDASSGRARGVRGR